MLLPSITAYHNAGKHATLGDSPFYLMFLRESRIPYESILPKEAHDDPTMLNKSELKARCLEMARKAIVDSQDRRLGNLPTGTKTKIDIGDIVYIIKHTVARKDHKLLPKWYGPHRVLDLKGMTAIIKAIKTGCVRQVSLRQVKLVHHSGITKTENKNADEVFPTSDSKEDFPPDVPCSTISRHGDVQESIEGDDVIWLPNIEGGGDQETIAAKARHNKELKIGNSKGLSGKGYASQLKVGRSGSIGGKPPRVQLCSDDAVASRTRSRKK